METSSLAYPYSQDSISAAVVDQLARTKGWVRFFSVLLWLGVVLLIFMGIAMMGVGLGVLGAAGEEIGAQFAAIGGAAVLGIFYLAMAIFYVYPALKLGKFASRIADLRTSPTEQNLVAALNEQRAFWKYIGVLMIVMFVLYIVAIIGILAVTFIAMGATASGM